MAKYDLYRAPNNRHGVLFLLEVQSGLLSLQAPTTVVIPVRALQKEELISVLNPVLLIQGGTYMAITQEITTVLRSKLGALLGNMSANSSEITAALDRLFDGY